MPQNWLFLKSYQKHREHLLRYATWDLLARLGAGAFETITGEVVNAILLTLTHARPSEGQMLRGLDASGPKTPEEKAGILAEGELVSVGQKGQLENSDARVALSNTSSVMLLERIADAYQGVKTGDDARHRGNFWEIPRICGNWRLFQTTLIETQDFGGLDGVLRWSNEGSDLARKQGLGAWGRYGVAISQMRELPVARYLGDPFDSNMSPIVAKHASDVPAIWCFCSSM